MWIVEMHEVPATVASDIVSAASEACLNVVEHAYGASGGILRVAAIRDGYAIQVKVIDSGEWRDAPSNERGRGLLLMQALMDDVDVVKYEVGTMVTMRKAFA